MRTFRLVQIFLPFKGEFRVISWSLQALGEESSAFDLEIAERLERARELDLGAYSTEVECDGDLVADVSDRCLENLKEVSEARGMTFEEFSEFIDGPDEGDDLHHDDIRG